MAGEAWEEAVEIAKSEDGWKEEKKDKKTVSFCRLTVLTLWLVW